MKQCILWVFLALLLGVKISYAACYRLDEAGRKWVTLTTTAKSIGIVSTIKQCSDIVFQVAKSEPTVVNAIPANCELKFYCDSAWGAIYDMNQNTSLRCPRVFIRKGELGYFDNLQMIDGNPVCGK